MLDSVKIDRDATAQSQIVAKRMARKEEEIFKQLMQHHKYSDHVTQLDEEIARLEGDMVFAELKEARRREYNNKHTSTLRAQALHVPPPSHDVAYRSSSRVMSERVPAHIQVRIDDILLERADDPAEKAPPLPHSHSRMGAPASSSFVAGGGRASPSLTLAATKAAAAASRSFPSSSTTVIGGGKSGAGAPPLPSIDGRSPYRRRSNQGGDGGGEEGGGLNASTALGGASSSSPAAAASPTMTATAASASSKRASEAFLNRKLQTLSKRVGDDKLIYNDTPFMLSVGRMRASSPSALQRKMAMELLNATTTATASAPSAISNMMKKKGRSVPTIVSVAGVDADVTAKISSTLLSRTAIDGEPIPDSDDEGEGNGDEGGEKRSQQQQQQHHHPIPTLTDVNEVPWKTRATHDVLIRDPYMRKHGLHRFTTYLYSDKFKEELRNPNSRMLTKKIVDGDGCDFDYRGNIRGEGMQRGNVSK